MNRFSGNLRPVFLLTLLLAAILSGIFLYLRKEEPLIEPEDFYMTDLDPKNIKGCKSFVDDYCHQLHSKEARGNLRIKNRDLSEAITRAGSTINNFDSATFAYHKARLRQRYRLPKDLQAALTKRNFFEALENLLDRPPRNKMTLQARIYYSDLESNVDSKWDQSIDEVVLSRLTKKFPKVYGLDDNSIPREMEVEYTRTYYSIWTDISTALWSHNSRWIKIKSIFDKLKESFARVISDLNVDDEVKSIWLKKILAVKLKTPGFNPAVASRDCITVSRNAYYYPYLNTITVCAGYLNTGEQIQTLAHELAHAIDSSSRLIDYLKESDLQNSLRNLRASLCKKKDFTCEQWNDFNDTFEKNLKSLSGFKHEVYSFHRCLKKNVKTIPFREDDAERISKKITDETFSSLIQSSALFRITKKKVPLASGAQVKNISYLNPCDYYTWDLNEFSIDGELSSLLMFTANYQCTEGDEISRIRSSIVASKALANKITTAVLNLENEFSARSEMTGEHLSSSPTERFADRMGSYIVADYLKGQQAQGSPEDTRSLFLASSYWLCDRPSLQSKHIEEYQSLSDIIIDKSSHEDNSNRIKDWLSPQIREILRCEKDFEHTECSIDD
jgi:tellurite resistance protein